MHTATLIAGLVGASFASAATLSAASAALEAGVELAVLEEELAGGGGRWEGLFQGADADAEATRARVQITLSRPERERHRSAHRHLAKRHERTSARQRRFSPAERKPTQRDRLALFCTWVV